MKTKLDIIKKFISSEVFRYLFFGGLTTVVSLVSYFLCSEALSVGGEISQTAILISNIFSWVFAVAFAYVTNKFFVFDSKSLKPYVLLKEAASFFSARIFSLIVECLWLYVTTGMGMNDKLSKVIGQIFVVVINYVLSKVFIFKKEKQNAE